MMDFDYSGDPDGAATKIELNMLDTNISTDRLQIFLVIAAEESEKMVLGITNRMLDAGFSGEEITALINNIMGTVAESPEDFRIEIKE